MKNNNSIRSEKKEENVYQPARWKDLKSSLSEFWKEFRQIKYGVIGLVLLIIFILMAVFEPFIIPFPEAGSRWRDVSYWDNNPRNAAPVWVNWYSSKDLAVHEVLNDPEWNVEDRGSMKVIDGTFNYDYNHDVPPQDFVFRAQGKGDITLNIKLKRPDGQEVNLIRNTINNRNENEIKISLTNDAVFTAVRLGSQYESDENRSSINMDAVRPMHIMFAEAQEGMMISPEPLKGNYQIKIEAVASGNDAFLKDSSLTAMGNVYGLLGTDNARRDIWSGVVSGIKWALMIGLLVSFVSVMFGMIFGVTSAYFGGWIDSAMMRVFEVFRSIPILPVLIVISAVYEPSIWMLILIMCIFYWVGPVRTVRSMGMQIKEETYVEAAEALNASHSRIVFKHMLPQLIPYAFATMALRVPAAIIAEASISLLGLGDASITTWGQILEAAMSSGAVLQGLWWWVVPPGIFIALMGMTFAFIGFSMDKILNPKLKTR